VACSELKEGKPVASQQAGSTKKGRKLLTLYPNVRALQVLGTTAGHLNQSLECWANLVARAGVENARRFLPDEWLYLADCCNGTVWEPDFSDPGRLLAEQVREADHFDALGARWLTGPADVPELAEKLSGLNYAQAWAVIIAVQFFWDNRDEINVPADEWWTVPYRLAFMRARVLEKTRDSHPGQA
jgi:hypothetical protein